MIKQKSPPVATYRIQLNKDFTFQDLLPVTDYLRDLGVSHVYLSPVLESAPGSNHGYDTIDFAKVSGERGGEAGLKALGEKITALGLRLIVDIVPNHMGAHTDNPYWRDVLAQGRASPYWMLFDMRVPDGGKTQLPVLGGTLDEALAQGLIKLQRDASGAAVVACGGKSYPLSAPTQAELTGQGDLSSLAGDRLKAILAAQNYEFVYWETVKDHVSYRRFFDVNELIGARVEDGKIFDLTHGYLNTLFAAMPSMDGIRVDHIDGLVDPAAYLQRLAGHYDAIWVENILGRGEAMPAAWPVRGTTGYEFTAFLNDLMTDRTGFETIEEEWSALTLAPWTGFHDAVKDGKTFALEMLFPSELKRLCALFAPQGAAQEEARMFWKGITLFLPVYRTYYDDSGYSAADRAMIQRASTLASAYFGDAYDKAAAIYLPDLLDPATDQQKQAAREWQQLSGPTTAKGLEDTAHYNYVPLTALNEVGCEASLLKADVVAAIEWLNERARLYPQTMNATSTHDTKRSEDVRARLYALSAMPSEWLLFVHHAMDANHGLHSPGAAEEYFLYQAILGTWPFDGEVTDEYRQRILQYMKKYMKESKRRTSWLHPDEAYEKSVLDFTGAALGHAPFLELMAKLAHRVAPAGAMNALAVQTLKCLLPGQPDIYQGTEDWDFSLVDPDNRRPVDYAARKTKLDRVVALEQEKGRLAVLAALTAEWQDGAIKLWLTRRLLAIRREVLMPMGQTTVAPLPIAGAGGHLIGFRLTGSTGDELLIVVPRNAVTGKEIERLALPDLLIDNVSLAADDGKIYRDLAGGLDLTADEVRHPAVLLRRFPIMMIAVH